MQLHSNENLALLGAAFTHVQLEMEGFVVEKYGSSTVSRTYVRIGDTVREAKRKSSRGVSFTARFRKFLTVSN